MNTKELRFPSLIIGYQREPCLYIKLRYLLTSFIRQNSPFFSCFIWF